MLGNLISTMRDQKSQQRRAELYRNLIRHEAKIGGQLFGSVPKNGRREFFCLDKHTWVWHEEWMDSNNQRQTRTTRYDIRPNGLLKSQNGTYMNVGSQEAQNFRKAVNLYVDRVRSEIYASVV